MGYPIGNIHKAVGKVDQTVKEEDILGCIGWIFTSHSFR